MGLGAAGAFDGAEEVELTVSRLGPRVRVEPAAASRARRRDSDPAVLRRAC
jgi:hypothetical protein